VAGNLARGKAARQLSRHISPAAAAVDGDVTTASCTDNAKERPWWAVDLSQLYDIAGVDITPPNLMGSSDRSYCNHRQFPHLSVVSVLSRCLLHKNRLLDFGSLERLD